MDAETTIARLVELTKRAEGAIELALKLKGGVLAARSPLFVRGKKVPIAKRYIEIYKPRGREMTPGQIHADAVKNSTDPHLAYTVKGPRQNYVKVIHAPVAKTKEAAGKNVGSILQIRKAFTDHLDRRGIVSRTHASAFGHESVATPNLQRFYRKTGFKVDLTAAKNDFRKASAGAGDEFARELLRNRVPMVRRPKSPQ